ncbi:hypothetical protein [Halobacteriovorax sp. BALOs_7]|uniref:hypothetical protein n=1 Tax=Halobacteriovorax sp. BALOs_7 TaxID=2109558 RepID=UPI0013C4D861|nr:hypothetical protein [Halobacteriovorax sp. BALOs_7]
MKKVFNILFYLACVLIIAILGGLTYHYYEMPLRDDPAPYKLSDSVYGPDDIASNTDVLVIGDDLGMTLNPYIGEITTKLSQKLARPLAIYNISAKNESLFRTIEKVSKLTKVPKIIILATGFSEMQEELYPKSNKELNINNINFKIYRNLYIQSFIKLYPNLSKLFYLNENIKELEKQVTPLDYSKLSAKAFRSIFDKEVLLYQHRLESFLRELRKKGVNVLMVLPPINIEISNLKVCEDTTNDKIEKALQKLDNLLEQGKTKEGQLLVESLDKKIVANTKYHQLKQELYRKQGQITKSYEQALLKLAFACEVESSHPVFTKILERTAINQNIDIVDFQQIIKENYMRNPLFVTKKTPQDIYYPKLVNELVIKLKQLTQLQ